jgi:hypothetical protein
MTNFHPELHPAKHLTSSFPEMTSLSDIKKMLADIIDNLSCFLVHKCSIPKHAS